MFLGLSIRKNVEICVKTSFYISHKIIDFIRVFMNVEDIERVLYKVIGIKNISDDYFNELLEHIRDIKTSEKRFYKKITDIYVLSVDYNSKSFVSTKVQ